MGTLPPAPRRLLRRPPGLDASLKENTGGTLTLTFNRTGEKWEFDAYDPHYLSQIKDRNNNTVSFTYSSQGLTKITDTQGKEISFTYNAAGELTKMSDATGREWQYGYSTVAGDGNVLTTYTDPEGKQTEYHFTTGGQFDEITDPRGHKIALGFDSQQRVTSITRVVDGTTANDVTTSYAYSSPSSPCNSTEHAGKTVVTDPRGKQTTYCANAKAQVVKVKDALGNDRARSYTSNGNARAFTDLPGTANPGLTTLSYADTGSDPSFNLTGGEMPEGEKFSIDYWSSSTSDPLQRYRPKKFTDEQGADEAYGYDAAGNLSAVKDDETSPRNQATLAYNSDGTLSSATDGNANQTTFEYFPTSGSNSGSLKKITPPSHTARGTALGTTQFTYDALSRTSTVTDGKSQVRTLTYDKLDRVKRVDLSDGSWMTFTYDNNGNLTQRADSAGNTTSYVFDKLNRRTSETFPGARTNTYTYDKASNLATLTDGGGTVTYGYDDINRATSIVSPTASGLGTDTVSYAFNDTANPRTQTMTLPGSTTQRTDLDLSGKPKVIEVKNSGGTTLRKLTYDYDDTTVTPTRKMAGVRSVTDQVGQKTTYTYRDTTEDIGRLLKARTETSGSSLVEEFRYAYDPAGNRTSKEHQTTSGTTTTSYKHNQVNQLCWRLTGTSSNGCATTPTGATAYTYDANGNHLTGNTAFAHDSLDRTTSIAGTSTSYLSPTQGELVSHGTTTFQNNVLGLGRQTAGLTTTNYVRDPKGAPVSQRTMTSKEFFLADRLGSTVGLTDTSGAIVRSYTYDPDGNDTTTGTGAQTDLRYARGHLVGGGLYHFGARFYDPSIARWTQQDPINQMTDLRQANRYPYVGGDPINNVDPSGQILCALIKACRDRVYKPAARRIRRVAPVVARRAPVVCYVISSAGSNDRNSVRDDVTDAVQCLTSIPDND